MDRRFEARCGARRAVVRGGELWIVGVLRIRVPAPSYAQIAHLETLAVDWAAHGVSPAQGLQRGTVRSDAHNADPRWRRERRQVWISVNNGRPYLWE